jgi:hydroxymethylpyrimidine/phosphomethylpyrimidine kinase
LKSLKKLPIALTIAGSDSGGGAGIQADLKTFASLGVHGTSAITGVTAQNPKIVAGILPCPAKFVRLQIETVSAELRPAAVKTGMLCSASVIREIADFFRQHRGVPLIVDPVMVSTSGAQLLNPAGLKALQKELLPLAALITPNLGEAELLLKTQLRSVTDLEKAPRKLHERFGCAVLVKGGHLPGGKEAVDAFYDGKRAFLLTAPFIRGLRLHGTGCTLSAAIAAWVARGLALPAAVRRAKKYIGRAIVTRQEAAGHLVLNHFQ